MKPRVMLIIPEMFTGGAQRSIAKLSVELSHCASIFLVIFNRSQPVAYTIGGQLLSLEVYPGRSWLSKTTSFFLRIRRLRKLKRQLGIETSISFLEGADYVNILSKTKEKIVLSIRGSKLHDEIMLQYHFWFRRKIMIPWLYRRADLIVAVNHGIARELTELFKIPANRVVIIHNFYDLKEITGMADEAKEQNISKAYQHPVLITSGRLAPEKRLLFLLKIFAELKKIKNDLHLIFVGDGPELKKLQQFCKENALTVTTGIVERDPSEVIFMGDQQNVFKYLKDASLYLLNSSSEGFPNGMIEAMICGVPVMSSDCPYGPREILSPDLENDQLVQPHVSAAGILMPLQNSEHTLSIWVETIASLLDDALLRAQLSHGARERVRDFDKDIVLDQWRAVIRPQS